MAKFAGPPELPSITRRSFIGAGTAVATATALSMANSPILAATSGGTIDPKQALKMAESHRGELIDLLFQLIAVRSHSGETAADAQKIVQEYLSDLPYSVEKHSDRPSRFVDNIEYMAPSPPGDGPFVNVVAHPNSGDGKHLALFAHIDTHHVIDGWSTDPYKPEIIGSRLYGLGSADDKGGVAAMLVSAALLARTGGPTPIVISHHGKGGGSRGSLPVFQRLKESGIPIESVLYSHPAETGRGLADIKNIVRGVLDFELHITGWRSKPLEIGLPDSSLWSDGGSALNACWGVINHLRQSAFRDMETNVGKLTAGDRIGSVPESAIAQIRVLFGEEYTWKDVHGLIESEAKSYLTRLSNEYGDFKAEVKLQDRRSNGGAVEWDSPTCRVLRDSIESVTGIAPKSYPNHYGGDIRFPIRMLGAPAFGIGSLGGNFYGPNEWVDVDDLVRLVAVLMVSVSRWSTI